MTENEISYIIRGVIFEIYNHFGPGLFESVYKEAVYVSLKNKGLFTQKEMGITANYQNTDLGLAYRMDILVENKVIVEIKSVEALADIHKKQLLTYLKLSGMKLGLLVNFNTEIINKSIIRIATTCKFKALKSRQPDSPVAVFLAPVFYSRVYCSSHFLH
jgi:GxxExxY protein